MADKKSDSTEIGTQPPELLPPDVTEPEAPPEVEPEAPRTPNYTSEEKALRDEAAAATEKAQAKEHARVEKLLREEAKKAPEDRTFDLGAARSYAHYQSIENAALREIKRVAWVETETGQPVRIHADRELAVGKWETIDGLEEQMLRSCVGRRECTAIIRREVPK